MKKSFVILSFLLLPATWVLGQDLALSTGYFGPYLMQPGIKVGAEFDFGKIYVSPQLAYFSRLGNNTNGMVNLEAGFRKQKSDKKFFSTYSMGVAYLYQSELLSSIVALGSSAIENTRESRHYFIPSLNFGFGWSVKDRLDWYTKISGAWKIAADQEGQFLLLGELGLKWDLGG